jgi:hypothetical protein
MLQQFPDSQLYADLHGFTDGQEPAEPGEMLPAFLRQISMASADIPPRREERSGLLRHQLASKRVLAAARACQPRQGRQQQLADRPLPVTHVRG